MKPFPLLLVSALLLMGVNGWAQELNMRLMKGMEARSIGPAGMSGRITAIDVVLQNPDIIYAGSASGGLWKSTDGGGHWAPIFDDQKILSIGAVQVAPSNPAIVWAGTGEGNPRNSQTSGAGIYKSLDAGKSWTLMGLENTVTIHRILIHPDDPNVVYVGATGNAWADNPERGVYKTTDGGKTWEKILYVNERTGVGDMVMDPQNPEKLLVAMWEYRRWPWFFQSGGEGSGLYVTLDGGESWEKRTVEDGLPAGELGRMGLAIAPSQPSRVYAFIESQKNAVYRSDNGGLSWRKMSDGDNIGDRPFYYADIHVDPQNENRVYSVYSRVSRSEDGGRTFQEILPYYRIHPDHHAWWIHPEDPSFMIDGNDGGLYITRDRGEHWQFAENIPVGQFYHISVDNEIPYNVYGGMQDNGSWRGPNRVYRAGGIRNGYWEEILFGDGFDAVPDPSNSRYGYGMSQGGYVARIDFETGDARLLRPVHPEGIPLRFNWNAAIATDPFDPQTVYFGSQFVHKSTDRGENWSIISPDLTTNDPEKQKQLESGGLTYDATQAENYTTILAIEPSPKEKGLLWVGTDDGRLQLTRDGGESWTDLYDRLPDAPEGGWIPQVRASRHDAGEAFVVVNNYRQGDWGMYVYRTQNYGKKWTRIADSELYGYALSFAQDPLAPNLYFLGTEFGLYVSVDAGANWSKWTHGFPSVSSMDLAIHPRDHDLVIGTFGRAIYVLDDIRPLRELAQQGVALLEKELHVFEAPDAMLAIMREAAGTRFAGEDMFKGENRPYGALLTYSVKAGKAASWAKKDASSEASDGATADNASADKTAAVEKEEPQVTIEILDEAGAVIRTLTHEPDTGVNRVVWRLDRRGVRFPSQPKPQRPDAREPGGADVLPGTYTVRMNYRGAVDSTTVRVLPDPRVELPSSQARQAALELQMKWLDQVELATEAADRLREAKADLKLVGSMLDKEQQAHQEAMEAGKEVGKRLTELMEKMVPKDDVQGILRDPQVLSSRLSLLRGYLRSASAPPNQTHQDLMKQTTQALKEIVEEVNQFFAEDWQAYQASVEKASPTPFEAMAPLKLEE